MLSSESCKLVSIIIPCYNREKLICTTLDSLLKQTYINWECLVVDDGSTDNTIRVVDEYLKKDNRIKLILRDRPLKGAPTCRNIGLENACGKYVIFLDSDDILFDFALQTRVDFLEINSGLDFCVSEGLRGEYPINEDSDYFLISTKKEINVLRDFFSFTPTWINGTPTFKKSFLLKYNIIWDEELKAYQDIDFHIRVILKTSNFSYIDSEPDFLWTVQKKGNIGSNLSNKSNNFQQKLHVARNFICLNKMNSMAYFPIKSEIVQQYLWGNLNDNDALTAEFFYKQLFDNYITIKLLKIYRFTKINNNRILRFIIRLLLFSLGQKKLLRMKIENTHFVIKPYDNAKILRLNNHGTENIFLY